MRTGMHRRAAVLTALFLAIVTLAMALMSANSGHDWGDDFAGYISQAIAIAQGTLEQQAHINLVTHPSDLSFLPAGADSLVYVWGLSLMLVPVYWLFGYDTDSFSSIIYYKLPGILCLAGLAAVLFLFYRRRFPWPMALLCAVALVFSAEIFSSVSQIGTDLPLLFFVMLSLLLAQLFFDSLDGPAARRTLHSLALGLSLWWAYAVRLNGVSVVLACLLSSALEMWKRRRGLRLRAVCAQLAPYLFFALLLLVSYSLLPVPTSNASDFGRVSLSLFLSQLEALFGDLCAWIGGLLPIPLGGAVSVCFQAFFWICFAWGAWSEGSRGSLPLLLLALGTLLGTCLLPYGSGQGLRYAYPALPLLLLFAGCGALRIWRAIFTHLNGRLRRPLAFLARALAVLAACVVLLASFSDALSAYERRGRERPVGDAFSTEAVEMYHYIQLNTPQDALISFFKPRLLLLNTGRMCCKLQVSPSLDPDPNVFLTYQQRPLDIDSIDYFLLYQDDGSQLDIILQELGAHSGEITPVYSNATFSLYQRVR